MRREAGPAAAGVAPDSLRRRVLAGVRGEPPPRQHSPVISAAVSSSILVAAIAVFVLLPTSTHRQDMDGGFSGGGAHAYLRRGGHHGELEVYGMQEPPIGEVYEVWLQRGGRGSPQPTDALFGVTSAGQATVEVPGDLRDVREVLVTAEPLGGSTSPTSAPVLRVAVAQA